MYRQKDRRTDPNTNKALLFKKKYRSPELCLSGGVVQEEVVEVFLEGVVDAGHG